MMGECRLKEKGMQYKQMSQTEEVKTNFIMKGWGGGRGGFLQSCSRVGKKARRDTQHVQGEQETREKKKLAEASGALESCEKARGREGKVITHNAQKKKKKRAADFKTGPSSRSKSLSETGSGRHSVNGFNWGI